MTLCTMSVQYKYKYTIVPDLFSKLESDWSVFGSFSDLFRVRGRAKVRGGLGTY